LRRKQTTIGGLAVLRRSEPRPVIRLDESPCTIGAAAAPLILAGKSESPEPRRRQANSGRSPGMRRITSRLALRNLRTKRDRMRGAMMSAAGLVCTSPSPMIPSGTWPSGRERGAACGSAVLHDPARDAAGAPGRARARKPKAQAWAWASDCWQSRKRRGEAAACQNL
jgi:hypothetical protein